MTTRKLALVLPLLQHTLLYKCVIAMAQGISGALPAINLLRQPQFFLLGEKPHAPDVSQVHANRIINGNALMIKLGININISFMIIVQGGA